jgi:peptide/nickel transport system substrate-binding protein
VKRLLIPVAILLVCAFIITGCGSGTTSTTPATQPPNTSTSAVNPTTSAPASTTPTAVKPTTATSTATIPVSAAKPLGGNLRWIEAMGPANPIGLPAECLGPAGVAPQITLQTLLKEQLDGSLTAGLAASYDVVTDAASSSVTFHLQKGVKFSDGTDFNAKAVKWNLDSIKAAPAYASSWSNWKSIDIIDDNTIKISFNVWKNGNIRSFADTLSYMISPTAFEKNGIDWVRWHAVGTGPFLMKDFQRDVDYTGTKNPTYWETGKPYLDSFQYLFVTDEMTRVALFKSGGAEVVNCNGNGRVANDMKASGYQTVSQALGPNILVPDSANPDSPWSNLKVRQAAEYALDKEAIASTFGAGWWTAAYQFSTPNSKAYDANLAPRKYDIAKAKALLTEAGYPNGFKTTMIAGPFLLNRDVVIAIQSQLGKVGITCDLQFPDMGKWSEISQNKWKNAILYSSINEWGNQNVTFDYFLADPVALNWVSVARPVGWKALLDASKATAYSDAAMLKKLEAMEYDNVLCIPIYSGSMMWAFTSNTHDTGEGTRGQSNWIEPQNIWMGK